MLQLPWTRGEVEWSNEFTLMYKGSAHKLDPDSSDANGRYRCEDESFFYI